MDPPPARLRFEVGERPDVPEPVASAESAGGRDRARDDQRARARELAADICDPDLRRCPERRDRAPAWHAIRDAFVAALAGAPAGPLVNY